MGVRRPRPPPRFLVKELPISHRLRPGGVTRVYKYHKMPGIFLRHLLAIFQILAQSRGDGKKS